MNTTISNSIKGGNRVDETTTVYQAWRTRLDAVLAEAGAVLVPRSMTDSSRVYGLKDIETDTSMGATITMQDYAIKTIEANLLRSALADAQERARDTSTASGTKPGVKPETDVAERRFTRRMRRNLNRLEPTLAYLNGRAYDVLKHSDRQISAAYGVMKGETEPSAFLVVSEPCRTSDGGTIGERHLLETHRPNDVLDFFGLEGREVSAARLLTGRPMHETRRQARPRSRFSDLGVRQRADGG